jgi:hypothetical protein
VSSIERDAGSRRRTRGEANMAGVEDEPSNERDLTVSS